jgi:hypothetical protein
VLKVVTPPGAAGLRGSVKDGLTLEPIGGALVELRDGVNPVVQATTNALGRYDSGNLPVGNYTVKITKAGYAVIETQLEIKLGTVSYKHWLLGETSGEEIDLEGEFDAGVIRNIDFGDVDAEDASIRLEAVGTTVSYFASSSPTGGQTGPVVTVNSGVPVLMKLSVFVAMIGLNGVNSFLNAQNIGSGSGGWKVTLIIP